MTHLKRLLWLAAWGAWLWLGFGLYRELPRELGPVVRRLWDDGDSTHLEFIGSTDRVVAIKRMPSKKRVDSFLIEVFDARDGRRDFSLPCPGSGRIHLHPTLPFAISDYSSPYTPDSFPSAIPSERVKVLDLTNGKWKSLQASSADHISVHPTLPLVAFLRHQWPTFVVLMNFHTGEQLFEYEMPTRFLLAAPPFFIGDDRIVLPLKAVWNRETEDAYQFKVLQFGSSKTARAVNSPPFSVIAATASTGRVAFANLKESSDVHVFDLERNAVIFSSPRSDNRVRQMRIGMTGPAISPSGRAVLGGGTSALWDIERGVALWSPGSWEVARGSSSHGYFLVGENWSGLWSSLAPKLRYQSFAVRSLETGGLLWRQSGEKPVTPKSCNSTGTLAALPNGAVYELPLRVNWLLLAICQTILALPLALSWIVLRWRRRRRTTRTAAS